MKENNIEYRRQMASFFDLIVNELFDIKSHISNQRYFEAGFALGGLRTCVINRQVKEIDYRIKNEEVQEEECNEECEESEKEKEVEDFENLYYKKCEELLVTEAILSDLQTNHREIKKRLRSSFDFIKLLHKNHDIPYTEKEKIGEFLLSKNEFINTCYGTLENQTC